MAALLSDKRFAAMALGILFAGCGGMSASSKAAEANRGFTQFVKHHTAGLGPVLQDAFGGGIFGWDISQNGSDGVLSETVFEQNGTYQNSIETFDESSAKITKVVRKRIVNGAGIFYFVDAIAGNDVGIIDGQQDDVINGQLVRDDIFYEMNPVSGNKITGKSTPPHNVGLIPSFFTNNESSSRQAMMAFRFNKNFAMETLLYPYNAALGIWGEPFAFPKSQAFAGYVLYAAVNAKSNNVLAGYQANPWTPNEAPSFDVFDVSSGNLLRTFQGLGMGFLNGMAIDSTTDIMCTTTQDMSVEFYKVSTGKGFAVQIPVLHGGGALTNGAAVAVDPVHHLFLIAQLNSTFSPNGGSTVIVYDEQGNIVEAINGFAFLNPYTPVAVHLAVNPAGRLGYAPGANQGQLQSFTY